jgi:hypothetical protein
LALSAQAMAAAVVETLESASPVGAAGGVTVAIVVAVAVLP